MRPETVRLRDMLTAARAAVKFAAQVILDEFREPEMPRYAILKVLEIVGEAAVQVSDETKAATPDIPWPKIVAMRHRLVHGYYDTHLDVVWRTIQEDLPPLIENLEELLNEAPE